MVKLIKSSGTLFTRALIIILPLSSLTERPITAGIFIIFKALSNIWNNFKFFDKIFWKVTKILKCMEYNMGLLDRPDFAAKEISTNRKKSNISNISLPYHWLLCWKHVLHISYRYQGMNCSMLRLQKRSRVYKTKWNNFIFQTWY